MKDTHSRHDNFLADALTKPKHRHISYWDGFRFGLGFSTAGLLVLLVLAGLTWCAASLFHVG